MFITLLTILMLEYYLWFCFATKSNGDNRQSTCGSKPSSGGGLMAHVSLDQPEGHLNFHKEDCFFLGRPESYPGAHDDDGEGDVDLEDVESQGPIELELEEDDGVVSRLLGHLRPRPQGPVDHDVLCQVERLHA